MLADNMKIEDLHIGQKVFVVSFDRNLFKIYEEVVEKLDGTKGCEGNAVSFDTGYTNAENVFACKKDAQLRVIELLDKKLITLENCIKDKYKERDRLNDEKSLMYALIKEQQ